MKVMMTCELVSESDSVGYLVSFIYLLIFFSIFVDFFAFIVTVQIRADRKQSVRERRVGSGNVLELGFEHGTSVAQRRCMSARCSQSYWH